MSDIDRFYRLADPYSDERLAMQEQEDLSSLMDSPTSRPYPCRTGLRPHNRLVLDKGLRRVRVGRNSTTSLSARYPVRFSNLFSASSWMSSGNPRCNEDPSRFTTRYEARPVRRAILKGPFHACRRRPAAQAQTPRRQTRPCRPTSRMQRMSQTTSQSMLNAISRERTRKTSRPGHRPWWQSLRGS